MTAAVQAVDRIAVAEDVLETETETLAEEAEMRLGLRVRPPPEKSLPNPLRAAPRVKWNPSEISSWELSRG